jgi:hypothetical protein
MYFNEKTITNSKGMILLLLFALSLCLASMYLRPASGGSGGSDESDVMECDGM